MSYYQTITENFYRYTDQEWSEIVKNNKMPERPDWVNIYLAGNEGNTLKSGRELPGQEYEYQGTTSSQTTLSNISEKIKIYPNPVIDKMYLTTDDKNIIVQNISIYDIQGKKVNEISGDKLRNSGFITIDMSAFKQGLYFINVTANDSRVVYKVVR